ncbi:unnamed protein product [Calicophoron daubneyi]|uniref:Mini-chromosome maintenance complex-binding protein n=1 Tax=Calicophoron daubneyi TaxID=300641 RepID=A0AAV2TSK4_CALDB
MSELTWLRSPLSVYDEFFATDKELAKTKFTSHISDQLCLFSSKVPIVNETPLDCIPDGHLVCLYGMVQDMFSTELFMDEFVVPSSGVVRAGSLRFRDFSLCEIQTSEEPNNVKFAERQSFYVVPVPGESPWVREVRAKTLDYVPPHQVVGCKRSTTETPPTSTKKLRDESGTGNTEGSVTLRSGMETDSSSTKSKKLTKQFPLAEEEEDSKVGVLVRVYDDIQNKLKVNEIVCIYGVLEHARLGSAESHDDDCISGGKGSEPIPHVHAILVHRLTHDNPLLNTTLPDLSDNPAVQLGVTRERIKSLLTDLFQGDELTSEYALLHFVSSRFVSESPYPNTFSPLNIVCPSEDIDTDSAVNGDSKMSVDPEYQAEISSLPRQLRALLPQLLTQLATVNLTLDMLNSGPSLMPIRNSEKGVLNAGRLQLSNGTQVLVDEMRMSTGQIEARGLLNLRALTMLATKQCVPYDFEFYTQDWETNARVLIVSTGPSLIKPAIVVPWKPQYGFKPLTSDPSHTEWCEMRKFLTLIQESNGFYAMDKELQDKINQDFVRWRRDKTTYVEADEFAVMLCLLRLHRTVYELQCEDALRNSVLPNFVVHKLA